MKFTQILELILLDNPHNAAVLSVGCASFSSRLFPSTQLSVNMLGYSTLWTASFFGNECLWLTLLVKGVNDCLLNNCQINWWGVFEWCNHFTLWCNDATTVYNTNLARMSFICHIHNYTEYNEEWNVFSAFNPSKCTHTWSSGQPTLRRPGSSHGLPARAGIGTHNLELPQVSSPTLYPLGQRLPI